MFLPIVKSLPHEDVCISIQISNHAGIYICDCGEASQLTVKDCIDTKVIFISHTHIDHFVHFDQFIRHKIGLNDTTIICGPRGIAKNIQAKLKSYTWNLIEPGNLCFEIRELVSDTQYISYSITPPHCALKTKETVDSEFVYENDAFVVTPLLLDHKTDSIAFRFDERKTVTIELQNSALPPGNWISLLKEAYLNQTPDEYIEVAGQDYKASDLFHLLKEKKGDSLGVIMDHAAHEKNHVLITDCFQNCNTVFIESFYKNDDEHLAHKNAHSFAHASGSILKRANVQHPIPVHFSRRYTDLERKLLIQEFTHAYNSTSNETL